MNEAHKTVLQRHQREIADDIIVTEELYGCLYSRKVFERNMIEMIKAERTPTEQVYKMLSLLPRRGPEAFEAFVDVLKVDYPWLATTLETSYKTATDSLSRQNSFSNLPICVCGGIKQDQPQDATPRQSVDMTTDQDIKTRVGTFIHKQFGHSKRVSQQDKKTMEKWMSDQLQLERKRMKKIESTSSEEAYVETNQRSICTSPVPSHLQENLRRTYEKVRDENLGDLLNNQNAENDSDTNDFDEADGPITMKAEDIQTVVTNLEGEVDKLINKQISLDKLVDQCHYILGDPDRKHNLANLVKDQQILLKGYEKELDREKKKSEKMLMELYDYSKSINNLESQRNNQRDQMKTIQEESKRLKTENIVLLEKCKSLEAANLQHVEKEKTLDNLRKMVADLKTSHGNLADENSNYRLGYGTQVSTRNYRRPPLRSQNRRGSILESTVNNANNKKTVSKPSVAMINARRKPLTRNW